MAEQTSIGSEIAALERWVEIHRRRDSLIRQRINELRADATGDDLESLESVAAALDSEGESE